MANVARMDVRIKTGDRSGAGTDGDVYVGIGGREFYTDSDSEDFERNVERTYTFGTGANVKFASSNSPAQPFQLLTETLGQYPAYVRFVPRGPDDNWNLESVTVTLNPGPQQVQYQALGGANNLWLGTHSGTYCYLTRI